MAKKQGSDPSLFLGFGIGFVGIIGGFIVEGGKPASLIGVSAFIIIMGGLTGTIVSSFSLKAFLGIPKILTSAMKSPPHADKSALEYILAMSEKSRKEGLLSLESDVEDIEDPFLKKGIRLAIDGVDSESITDILEGDIELFESGEKNKAAILDAAGGFAPTMGIIGTVTGLVLVLNNLGGDAGALGHSIAAAFIATLYGIGFANIIFLPAANKVKGNMKMGVEYRRMMLTAILSLQAGDSTMLVEAKLSGYAAEEGGGKGKGAKDGEA